MNALEQEQVANEQLGEQLLDLIKALADPVRARIVRVLKTDSFTVHELCNILQVKQPALSHHLKVLTTAHVAIARKEGNATFYRRKLISRHDVFGALRHNLFESIDLLDLNQSIASGMARIKQLRSQRARDFFDKNANSLATHQELIASPEQYLPLVADMLDRTAIASDALVIEVGIGRGDFLKLLSEKFKHIVALDISDSILAAVTSKLPQALHAKVTALHGDVGTAVQAGISATHIVCNMMLHHAPSPAEVFEDCARLLQPGGSLIVTELCRHEQTWALDKCGDLWLGFEPAELSAFAERAGFRTVEETFFGLRNGFQIQMRRFEALDNRNTSCDQATLNCNLT